MEINAKLVVNLLAYTGYSKNVSYLLLSGFGQGRGRLELRFER